MRKKNIILLAAIGTILAATVLIWLLRRDRTNGPGPHDSSYQIEDTASITKIAMADKLDNRVTLERKGAGAWIVDGKYPASQPMINHLLETLKKMRIRAEVNRDAIPNRLKDIATYGIQVDIYQNGEPTKTYYVGRETQDHMASFMIRKGDSLPCEVHIPGFRGYLTPTMCTTSPASNWRYLKPSMSPSPSCRKTKISTWNSLRDTASYKASTPPVWDRCSPPSRT